MEVVVRRLAKYALVCMLVIFGILIACAAFVHFINLDPYRARIQSMATRAMGRQVYINGHIDINLFPRPAVILNDLSLANAEWGTEPIMAKVGHFDAAIGFLSLFSDTIIIRQMHLNDVALLLEKNDQQGGNWILETKSPSADAKEETGKEPEEVSGLPVIIEFAEFSNITVTVRAPESNDQVYRLTSLSLQPDESGNLILKSSGDLLGNPMAVNCSISSKKSFFANDAVSMDLQASLGDAKLSGRMATNRLAPLADLNGTLRITVPDMRKALEKAKIDVPVTGPLTVNATVDIDGSVYRTTVEAKVEGLTATADGSYADKQMEIKAGLTPLNRAGELFGLQGLRADALDLKAKVTGSAADGFEVKQFQAGVGKSRLSAQGRINLDGGSNLKINLASPDLSTLLGTLPPIDLKAKASAMYTTEKIAVSGLAVTFGKSDLNGDITMFIDGKRNLTAKLGSKLLDLRAFSRTPRPDDKTKKVPSKAGAMRPAAKKTAPADQYVFKKTPLQLERLENVEANVTFSVDHMYYNKLELKNALIEAVAHNGHLDAKLKADSANEGHAAARIDLATRGGKATVDTLASLSDLRTNLLSTEGISPAETPPISVTLELKSAGSSPRDLASTANGRILFTQGPGKISNNMMAMFSSDIIAQLFQALNPFAKHEQFSNWDCTVVSVDIVDGRAKIDSMLAQAEKVTIVGGGTIDLKTEKLDVEFNTKPRSGVGISADMFVTPFIKVGGTLASPGIGLNKKGTLLTGGAAVATGGLSLLLKGLLDRTTAEQDQCPKALENAGAHTPFSF